MYFFSRPASYYCLHFSYLPCVTNQIIIIFHKNKKQSLRPHLIQTGDVTGCGNLKPSSTIHLIIQLPWLLLCQLCLCNMYQNLLGKHNLYMIHSWSVENGVGGAGMREAEGKWKQAGQDSWLLCLDNRKALGVYLCQVL